MDPHYDGNGHYCTIRSNVKYLRGELVGVLTQQHFSGVAASLGYGNPAGPVWFIGAEEGLGGAMSEGEQEANIMARSQWDAVMDMFEAHLTLTEDGKAIDISQPRKGSIGVWLWMARIARAHAGMANPLDKELATEYVRQRLGRKDGTTFLTELSPLPTRATNAPHGLMEFADTAEGRSVLATRKAEIRSLLVQHRPELIICYGKNKRAEFAEFLGVKNWKPFLQHKKTDVEACELPNVYRLPFFGQGQMSYELMGMFLDRVTASR